MTVSQLRMVFGIASTHQHQVSVGMIDLERAHGMNQLHLTLVAADLPYQADYLSLLRNTELFFA